MSLTDSLRYQLKSSAVSSRSYKHKVSPTNGLPTGNSAGQLTRLDIPSGMRNTYLDPSQTWLEFTWSATYSGQAATSSGSTGVALCKLDGSAHSLIRRIEVYSSAGSNLLESIDNYNILYQACANVVGDIDDMSGAGSLLEGYAPPVGVADAVTTTSATSWSSRLSKYRESSGMLVASGVAYTFQLPLLCMIGTLGEKYIPLHALAADLRVEITWGPTTAVILADFDDYPGGSNTAAVSSSQYQPRNLLAANTSVYGTTSLSYGTPITSPTSTTFAITAIFLHCTMIQISDDAQAAVDAMTGGIYTWHGSSWRNFETSLASASTSISFLIPARYSSLKQLLVTHTPTVLKSAQTTFPGCRSITSFYKCGMTQYQFRVGSVLIPQARVNASASDNSRMTEACMELLRSFHAINQNLSGSPINNFSWTQDLPITQNGTQATFCVGLELESFANKSDVIMSGISTLGQNVFFEATYVAANNTFTGNWTVDAFASYDVLFTLQDGVLTAQF